MYQTMTMAQACGEAPMPGLSFVPGEDFDPSDPDDVEAVGLAMDRERADELTNLRAENARLRAALRKDDDHG